MTTLERRALAWQLALGVCTGGLFGCAGATSTPAQPARPAAQAQPAPPPRDADGTPGEATALALGAAHTDGIDRSKQDLDDWYRIEIPGQGNLTLRLQGPGAAALPGLTLALTDAKGAVLGATARTGGRSQLTLGPRQVARGPYLVWVGSEGDHTGAVPYEVRTAYAAQQVRPPVKKTPPPPPPPPAPRFQVKSLRLVELSAGGQQATIGGGRADGITVGLQGRLLSKGAVIAKLRVIEVYERGSRVQLEPALSEAPSGATSVEVDIPIP